jgi:methylase of polypeptide subunit release factors
MKNHFSMMDVGTGAVGVLALYSKYLFPQARIYGVDQFDFIVASASNCALKNNLPVNFLVGNLLNGVRAQFNLIVFNPPYIDEKTNERLRILDDSISYKKSSGGPGGCITINRFLTNISDYLTEDGLVLLGANEFYVPRKKIKHMVSQNSLKVIEILGNNLTMSYVFVIRK